MTNNELAVELKNYLKKHLNDPNFWSRDIIGKQIKEFCVDRGNFKKAPSGNPRKGYNNMIKVLNKRNGNDYDD